LASLLNCDVRLMGRNVTIVYLAVVTWFEILPPAADSFLSGALQCDCGENHSLFKQRKV